MATHTHTDTHTHTQTHTESQTHQHRTFAETRCQNTDTTHIKYQDAEMQISRNQQATSSVYHTELYRTIIKQEGQHPLTGIGTPNFM